MTMLGRFAGDLFRTPGAISGTRSTAIAVGATVAVSIVVLLRYILSRGAIGVGSLGIMAFPILFCGFVSLNVMNSPAGNEATNELIRWFSYLLVATAAAVAFRSPADIKYLASFVSLAALGQTAFAAYQYLSGALTPYQTGGVTFLRATGTFPHPAWFALFLVFGIGAAQFTGWPRPARIATQASLGAGVIISFSRGPIVFGLATMLMLALVQRRPRIIAAALATGFGLALIPSVRLRFLSELSSDGQLEGSYASRFLLQRLAFDSWGEHVWAGNGAGSFFTVITPSVLREQLEAHSDIAKLLADEGLIGAVLYYSTLLVVVAALWRRSGGRVAHFAVLPMVLVATLAVMGLVDSYHRLNTTMTFLWLLVGAGLGYRSPTIPGTPDSDEP